MDVQIKGVNNALVRDFVGILAFSFGAGFARIDDLGSVHVAVTGNSCGSLNGSGIGNGNFAAGNGSQFTRLKGNRHNGVFVSIFFNSNFICSALNRSCTADFYAVLLLNQLACNRGIGNLEGSQAGDVFRYINSQGIRHGIANTVIGLMCFVVVALGDGLFNVGAIVVDR